MEFVNELGPVLVLLPAFIIAITNSIKGFVPDWFVFMIPYIISVVAMFGLFVVFNESSLGIYMINAIIVAFGSSTAYDASKIKKSKEGVTSQINIHDRDTRVLDQMDMLKDAEDLLAMK